MKLHSFAVRSGSARTQDTQRRFDSSEITTETSNALRHALLTLTDRNRTPEIVAMDALHYGSSLEQRILQYKPENMRRDLEKAYCAFQRDTDQGISTGVCVRVRVCVCLAFLMLS